jgi:hypothetical protein
VVAICDLGSLIDKLENKIGKLPLLRGRSHRINALFEAYTPHLEKGTKKSILLYCPCRQLLPRAHRIHTPCYRFNPRTIPSMQGKVDKKAQALRSVGSIEKPPP